MKARTLKIIGAVVLVLGLGSAFLLYRQSRPATSSENSDWKDSTLSLTDSKANTRNIELYGGKLEVLMVKCVEWLHRPESLTAIVATLSTLIALVCFVAAIAQRAGSGRQIEKGEG
jgi:hypothetical protein